MMTSNYPATLFGKIPAFGDFVRVNASTPEAEWFDRWLQQGIVSAKARCGAEWKPRYEQLGGVKFLVCPAASEVVLTGVFTPSADLSGREYPLWLLTKIPRTDLGEQFVPVLPAVTRRFLMEAVEFLSHATRGADADALPELLKNVSTLSEDELAGEVNAYRHYLMETPVEDILRGSFGETSGGMDGTVMKSLRELLVPMRGQDLSRWTLGLRFPLRAAENDCRIVAFWLQVCMKILGNPIPFPSAFWTANNGADTGFLYLYFREPPAGLLGTMLEDGIADDSVFPIESGSSGSTATGDRSQMMLDEMLIRL